MLEKEIFQDCLYSIQNRILIILIQVENPTCGEVFTKDAQLLQKKPDFLVNGFIFKKSGFST